VTGASMTPAKLVQAARGYLGVPWRHLGRSRAGVDCIGLVLLAARACGHDLPDPAPYEREPQGARLVSGLLAHGARVTQAELGDVMVFRMGVYGGHIGIATLHPVYRVPGLLHAFATRRHVVEQPIDAEFRAALVAVVRVAGG
jgi:cell wall-associated NlpC family hydrolase